MLTWRNQISLSTVTFNMLRISSFGNAHRLPENEILNMFVSGLKPSEKIYSHAFETLVDVMAETRHELANYRDIMRYFRYYEDI